MAGSEVDSEWRVERVTQKIMLGEIVVLRPRFDALVHDASFLRLPSGLDKRPPKEAMKAAGAAVVSLESYPVAEPLPRLAVVDGYLRYVAHQYRHYFVRLDGTFESYLAGFRGKTRSTLLRKVRKLERAFPGERHFSVFDRPEQMDTFLTLARRVAEKTFQEHLFGHGVPDTPGFRETLKKQAARGEVEGYVLQAGGEPLAYIVGTVRHGDTVIYDFVGYDPAYREWSPGTVLQYFVVQHLFQHPRFRVYDLCTGEGEHKRMFATDHQLCADIRYFPPHPRYLAILSTQLAFQGASRAIIAGLDRLQLKARVKQALRDRARAAT